MIGIKRFNHGVCEYPDGIFSEMNQEADGDYVLFSDHEAEVARLRDEVEWLRNALTPFAEFALVRSAAGSTSPKTGPVYSVHTRLGEAEITAEDFESAFNAIGASI